MAEIDAKMIKELRDKTGMGVTACKNALTEAKGDLEAAEMILRKAGIDKAAKKAERATGEGIIAVKLAADGKSAVIIEAQCEQEPTKNNERFVAFVNQALELALGMDKPCLDCLLAAKTASGTLGEDLKQLIGTLSENLNLRRVAKLAAPAGGILGSYVHFNKKAGAVSALKLTGAGADNAALKTAANDVCMHAVAARPLALSRADIPADVIAKEKEVFSEEVKGKPDNIKEKILEGKLGKFYAEKVLGEQIFVKDPEGKQTVNQFVTAAGKAAGGQAELAGFIRYELGL